MSEPDVDIVLPVRARLGECPIWDARSGHLWWIDIDGGVVHRTDPATGEDDTVTLPARPGSIALTSDPDRLVSGMEHDVVDIAWPSGAVTVRVEVEAASKPTRLNDGRCDARGRYWMGSMRDPAESSDAPGGLFRVDAGAPGESAGVHVELDHGVAIANGMAFAPDGATMYWADSIQATVWAYDYDLDTGARSNQRVFARFDGSAAPGLPDGACVDADGCYWVACVTGSAVARFSPDGRLDRVIEVPVRMPTMPAFGGPDLSTLFVTSIGGDGASSSVDETDPLAGALLAIDVGVRGVPEPLFAG